MGNMENGYDDCRQVLEQRLHETAPGSIQILTGPRQVGKTTLLLELAEQFGNQAVYAAGDDPSAALPGFLERCWADAEARAWRLMPFLRGSGGTGPLKSRPEDSAARTCGD